MALSSCFVRFGLFSLVVACAANGQLTPNFYSSTCPSLQRIVRSTMAQAMSRQPRLGASVLRLFFHDCFVNGCDGSLLLDDTPTFTGEKNAVPNQSARGFELIDAIKSRVDAACNGTVSCADILALATREGVTLLGGPSWSLGLGRRDARTASQSGANNEIPGPSTDLQRLISMFDDKGLNARDMTALSGAHTIGQSRCFDFRNRIYNESNIDANFASMRRAQCPRTGGDNNLAPLDLRTPNRFDNNYYRNLVTRRGLLHSDQQLFNGGSTDSLVQRYSRNGVAFSRDFSVAMAKMASITPLTGNNGEVRRNCGRIN